MTIESPDTHGLPVKVGTAMAATQWIPAGSTERWLLGAMLESREAINQASWLVQAQSFSPRHRPIANRIFWLNAQRLEVNPRTVSEALTAVGALGDVGGAEYLHELVRDLPPSGRRPDQIEYLATSIADSEFAKWVECAATDLLRVALRGNRQQIANTYAHIHAQFCHVDYRADTTVLLACADETVVTALYFWYDDEGILLYIGITNDLATRQASHAKRSSWSEFATDCKVRRFPSRREAEAAEKAAIEAERPLFNHVHNDTPEARARLVAYLIEHGRMDLLAPAVSRG